MQLCVTREARQLSCCDTMCAGAEGQSEHLESMTLVYGLQGWQRGKAEAERCRGGPTAGRVSRPLTPVMLPSPAQTEHCHCPQSPSDQALPRLAGDICGCPQQLLSACRGPASSLTIAEQMALLQQAKAQAETAEPDQAEAAALPPAVRVLPLGEDRRGALYWKLRCSAIVAGADWLSHLLARCNCWAFTSTCPFCITLCLCHQSSFQSLVARAKPGCCQNLW